MWYKILFFILILLCISCSSKVQEFQESRIDDKSIEGDNLGGTVEEQLARLLRRESGVLVTESGGRYRVSIRGIANSLSNQMDPLFVVNGVGIDHTFEGAVGAILGMQIVRVRVLKDQAASIYGVRGAGGVIEITAK